MNRHCPQCGISRSIYSFPSRSKAGICAYCVSANFREHRKGQLSIFDIPGVRPDEHHVDDLPIEWERSGSELDEWLIDQARRHVEEL